MKRKRAVFTNIHNEPLFFPIWLKWYQRFFEPFDIYVIHLIKPNPVPFDRWIEEQQATFGGFQRLVRPDLDYCNFQLVVDRVMAVQKQLLEIYDSVLFAEVDEFIYHPDGLDNYIDSWQGDWVRCTGYEVIHHPEEEPPLDLSKPIIAQRKWWAPDELYNKPLLTRIPLKYIWGFHRCHEEPDRPWNHNLYLIHLRRMDYKICEARALERQRNESDSDYAREAKAGGAGFQHWLSEYQIRSWFNLPRKDETLIPESIRQLQI